VTNGIAPNQGASLEQELATARALRQLPCPRERRLIRQRARASQGAIALALGISRPLFSMVERGKRLPGARWAGAYVDILERLAQAARK
jgi:hypothetical protein